MASFIANYQLYLNLIDKSPSRYIALMTLVGEINPFELINEAKSFLIGDYNYTHIVPDSTT